EPEEQGVAADEQAPSEWEVHARTPAREVSRPLHVVVSGTQLGDEPGRLGGVVLAVRSHDHDGPPAVVPGCFDPGADRRPDAAAAAVRDHPGAGLASELGPAGIRPVAYND